MLSVPATDESVRNAGLRYWREPVICCDSVWEENYARFETPEEEIRKFMRRFRQLGASRWRRDARILDLFCGRGSGLKALEGLGFRRLEGVDLSEPLLIQYSGPAQLYVGDAGELKVEDASIDIVVVQGGLHHLPVLDKDLERVLREIHRVLKSDGRFVLVEPWETVFLRMIHFMCRQALLRRGWSKLGALASMIEREHETYFHWLDRPQFILSALSRFFVPELLHTSWGKLRFVGRKLTN